MRYTGKVWMLEPFKMYTEQDGVKIELPNEGCIIAKQLGFTNLTSRLKATWLVFSGKADAVLWVNK